MDMRDAGWLDRYVSGYREAEDVGKTPAKEYALEGISADEGAPLKIVEG